MIIQAVVRMLAVVLAVCIGLPATPATASVPRPFAPRPLLVAPPLSGDERAQLDELVEQLAAGEQKANEAPAEAIEPLQAALARVEELGPLVARSSKAHESRIYALLALARAHLVLDQRKEAAAAMDRAIRVARGDPIPAKLFGPSLVALHDDRVAAEQNHPGGKVVVSCTIACEVLLDERVAGSGTRVEVMNVPFGPHRVHVQAADGSVDDVLAESIALSADASEATLDYAVQAPPPGEDIGDDDPPPPVGDDVPKRRLPRWAGIVGISVGAAAMIAGGVLIGIDGRCPDGSDPQGEAPCIDVLNTDGAGIGVLVGGAALLTGFSIALGIGEARDKKRRRASAMVGYTFRF
jgi:hypothetical protein